MGWLFWGAVGAVGCLGVKYSIVKISPANAAISKPIIPLEPKPDEGLASASIRR